MSRDSLRIAVDLGTTTIAAAVVSSDNAIVCSDFFLNPQRQYGLDVVKRLEHAAEPDGQKELQTVISDALESAVEHLLSKTPGFHCPNLYVAGNTVMQTLLCGGDTYRLAHPPFRPLETGSIRTDTSMLGWNRSFPLYIFPQPSGFVGGDLAAFLFSEKKRLNSGRRLFVDIGTNAEIALACEGTVFATSAAAGPAFEAGSLSCGMIFSEGAVASVSLNGSRLDLAVAGGKKPSGICGSGVISLIALLLKEKVIDSSGRLIPLSEGKSLLGGRVSGVGKDSVFTVYRDSKIHIFISQQDVREIQLASAAVRGGIDVLLERGGITEEEIDEVIITGSFGAHLLPEDLARLGILSKMWVPKTVFIRNGALDGVISASESLSALSEMESLSGKIKVIPLSGTPNFERHFIERMTFPLPADI